MDAEIGLALFVKSINSLIATTHALKCLLFCLKSPLNEITSQHLAEQSRNIGELGGLALGLRPSYLRDEMWTLRGSTWGCLLRSMRVQ